MKKILYVWSAVLFVVAVLFLPNAVQAADPGYDLGFESDLYLKAEVCNVADCVNQGVATDWNNFSTYSANPVSTGGDSETLTVRPGDSLTFRGTTSVTGVLPLNPTFGMAFTNVSYLDISDIFGSGLADIDGDANLYAYHSDLNIDLTGGLTNDMNPEVGGITATVRTDTPDQAVITAIFYVVDPGSLINFDFFASKAYAAGEDRYLMSTVRIVVNNPTTTPTATVTTTGTETETITSTATAELLPQTGASDDNDNTKSLLFQIVLISSAVILLFDLIRRKIKKI